MVKSKIDEIHFLLYYLTPTSGHEFCEQQWLALNCGAQVSINVRVLGE